MGGGEVPEVVFLGGNLLLVPLSRLKCLIRRGQASNKQEEEKQTLAPVCTWQTPPQMPANAQGRGSHTLGPTLAGSLALHSPALAPWPAPQCHG